MIELTTDEAKRTITIVGITFTPELDELLTSMAGEKPTVAADGSIIVHYIRNNWNCFRLDIKTALRQYLKR